MNVWNPSILFLRPLSTMANIYNAFSLRQKWSLCPQSTQPGLPALLLYTFSETLPLPHIELCYLT